MPVFAQKLLTAKEFAGLPDPPDGSRQELERGVVVALPALRHIHGRVRHLVGFFLGSYFLSQPIGHATSGSGILTESDPDTVRGPDLAFWSIQRLPLDALPEVYTNVPPDLAVEIWSPGNTPRKMLAKIKEYFTHGVRMVWIIDPDFRTMTIYRQPGKGETLWEDETISAQDVLPGFSCRVADFFPPTTAPTTNDAPPKQA